MKNLKFYVPLSQFDSIYLCKIIDNKPTIHIIKKLFSIQLFDNKLSGYDMDCTIECKQNELFNTYTGACSEIEDRKKISILNYCEEIKNLEELLMFPLSHTLYGDDVDEEARSAYLTKISQYIKLQKHQ